MWKQVSYQTDTAMPFLNKAMEMSRDIASRLGVDGTMQYDGNFDWLNILGFHAIDVIQGAGDVSGGVAAMAIGLHDIFKTIKEDLALNALRSLFDIIMEVKLLREEAATGRGTHRLSV